VSARPENSRLFAPSSAAILALPVVVWLLIAHEAEHVAQIVQKDVKQEQCPFQCHGLLGKLLDVEAIHWIYNFSMFVAMILIWVGLGLWRSEARVARPVSWWTMTISIFVIQGYHLIEHAAKIGQWMVNGHHSPTPGIVGVFLGPPTGRQFSLIEYHFVLNTVVLIGFLAGLWAFRPDRDLRWALANRSGSRRQAFALYAAAALATLSLIAAALAGLFDGPVTS
jgi:hypothetical protein